MRVYDKVGGGLRVDSQSLSTAGPQLHVSYSTPAGVLGIREAPANLGPTAMGCPGCVVTIGEQRHVAAAVAVQHASRAAKFPAKASSKVFCGHFVCLRLRRRRRRWTPEPVAGATFRYSGISAPLAANLSPDDL